MRGNDDQLQSGMFSYVSLEERIPAAHPLRGARKLADAVLTEMSKDFDGMYAKVGRLGDRRAGVESRRLQQEPRPAAQPGSGAAVLREGEGESAGPDER